MDWWSKLLQCPRCAGPLSHEAEITTGLIRCGACGPYPLLGGIPLLLADPFTYCAQFRDSILATLAEADLADRTAVAVVDAFARGQSTGEVFADDWTEHEATRSSPPRAVEGPASAALQQLEAHARRSGPGAWLAEQLQGHEGGTALEIGCGAGERTEVLARSVERLLVADRSLRAVLQATTRARATQAADGALKLSGRGRATSLALSHRGAPTRRPALERIAGVVLDAEELPLRARSVDLIVAEHLVDLLDAPEEFLSLSRGALKKGGALLLTTPEPSLGLGDDDALERLAVRAKFKVTRRSDGLPWLRVNSARFVEVYLVQALALRA